MFTVYSYTEYLTLKTNISLLIGIESEIINAYIACLLYFDVLYFTKI
jgi:hypothetical protein